MKDGTVKISLAISEEELKKVMARDSGQQGRARR